MYFLVSEIFLSFQCEGLDHRGNPSSSLQTVITLSKLITPQAMNQVLQFIYTGSIDSQYCELQVCSSVSWSYLYCEWAYIIILSYCFGSILLSDCSHWTFIGNYFRHNKIIIIHKPEVIFNLYAVQNKAASVVNPILKIYFLVFYPVPLCLHNQSNREKNQSALLCFLGDSSSC